MKSVLSATVATFAAAAAFLPAASRADMTNLGYVIDSKNIVVISGKGECVRSGSWTPALAAAAAAVKECTPDLAPPSNPAAATTPSPKPESKPAAKPAAKPETKPDAKPKPKTAAEPVQASPQKIDYSADALFDFDKADLKAEGKTKLDTLPQLLRDAKYQVIRAVGHADRIGSAKYNQKLSTKRAEAVKKYLIAKGIAADRISAEGKGKSQPVTQRATCQGKKSKALIACLQPDRRVTIEVTGTK